MIELGTVFWVPLILVVWVISVGVSIMLCESNRMIGQTIRKRYFKNAETTSLALFVLLLGPIVMLMLIKWKNNK